MQLLTNHIGYERLGSKQAVVLSPTDLLLSQAKVIRCVDQTTQLTVSVQSCGAIDQWHTGLTHLIDFSELKEAGEYQIQINNTLSSPFLIADGVLMQHTFSDVLHYFKSQRCSGIYDKADQSVPVFGTQETVDVHGGWYDASGDVSKYFSHLSYSNYFNPQQIPMVVWNLFTAFQQIEADQKTSDFTRQRILEEAYFGADFLARMQSTNDFFYATVFDKWSKSIEQREICSYATQTGIKSNNYQAGFRQGAGIAIAALAAAARIQRAETTCRIFQGLSLTEYDYLDCAERGYRHLAECNIHYLNDKTENIIDEYCALLSCVELFKTTENHYYLEESRRWAERLIKRQHSDSNVTHFWSANNDGSRPYFHAAEAGLPAISLLQYLDIESDNALRATTQKTLEQALWFELTITQEVNNPFGYPRQYVKAVTDEKHSAFFIPHDNETGYWWQGENARLASLATLAYMSQSKIQDPVLRQQLKKYGQNILNWIVGLNPFDMCMIDGHGYNNPDYLPHLGFYNAKGGICNGITSGFINENDIAFNPAEEKDNMLQNWRWGEQWIPHGAWYLLAVSSQYQECHHD